MTITIGIACFALVLVMFMQFKIVNETDITSIENMRETELRTELANWKTRYDETNAQYEETQKMIDEYNKTKESNDETEKLVNEELATVNMNLGKTDVEGQGIEIILRETTNEEITQINADDLLVIVNALKLAGAEAISINDERYVTITDIVDVENKFIFVNGQRLVSPYTIKAIGDPSYLESAVNIKGGYKDTMEAEGKVVSYKVKDDIRIEKYNGVMEINYGK